MYYIINAKSHYGYIKIFSFDGFVEIKEKVVAVLDGRGWDNKEKVDLRSLESCCNYLFDDFASFSVKKTKSYKKWINA